MFKVGDYVRVTNTGSLGSVQGFIEAVLTRYDGKTCYQVENCVRANFLAEELELAQPSGLAAWFPAPIKMYPNLFPKSAQAPLPVLSGPVKVPNISVPVTGWSAYKTKEDTVDLEITMPVTNPGHTMIVKLDKKCECGSTSVNSPFHSSWCPLHET